MKTLLASLKVFLFFSVLLGLVYPLFITAIAQITMPYQANGNLIEKDKVVIGSKLIGQSFSDLKYFHGRPSIVNYDGAVSGASNFGPSSKKLIEVVTNRIKEVRSLNEMNNTKVPADMVLASASGLDPHISPANAFIQSKRIAKIRGISENKIRELIKNNTDDDFIGLWGCPGVNVLELNLALDNLRDNRR